MKKNTKVIYADLGSVWGSWEGNEGGFIIKWGIEECGFGELTFYKKDGKVYCETECMDDASCCAIMAKFFENVAREDK